MIQNKFINSQIQKYKIKQGILQKRSKFLKQWRDRVVVLTQNYLICFKNKQYINPTNVIQIKAINSIKSYMSNQSQIEGSGIKISTKDQSFYFKIKNAVQKWSWIVAIQRMVDYKLNGATSYNNIDYIKTKGFDPIQNGSNMNSSGLSPKRKNLEKKASIIVNTGQNQNKYIDSIVNTLKGSQIKIQSKKSLIQYEEEKKSIVNEIPSTRGFEVFKALDDEQGEMYNKQKQLQRSITEDTVNINKDENRNIQSVEGKKKEQNNKQYKVQKDCECVKQEQQKNKLRLQQVRQQQLILEQQLLKTQVIIQRKQQQKQQQIIKQINISQKQVQKDHTTVISKQQVSHQQQNKQHIQQIKQSSQHHHIQNHTKQTIITPSEPITQILHQSTSSISNQQSSFINQNYPQPQTKCQISSKSAIQLQIQQHNPQTSNIPKLQIHSNVQIISSKSIQVKPQQIPIPQRSKSHNIQQIQNNKIDGSSRKISDLKQMFEKKASSQNPQPKLNILHFEQNKNISKINNKQSSQNQQILRNQRSKAIQIIFSQLQHYKQNMNGLQIIIQFLVDMGSDSKLGYSDLVIYEIKSKNQNYFGQLFANIYSKGIEQNNIQSKIKRRQFVC